jgi:hypothetical protein
MLQATLRAGSLAASQPALTLGDSLLSVILGISLFEERVDLGCDLNQLILFAERVEKVAEVAVHCLYSSKSRN